MKPIKQRKISAPIPEGYALARRLSAMFAEAGWMPSTENFADRDFVKFHGSFYSVAGFPDGVTCHSKCCKTEQEVLDFLASFEVEEAPVEVMYENREATNPAIYARVSEPSVPTLDDEAWNDVAEHIANDLTAENPREAELQSLRDQIEALQKENADLKTKPLPYPDEGEATPLPPDPRNEWADKKLSEIAPVGPTDPVEEEITTEHLLDAMRANADAAGEAIGKLSREKRTRFTELLNIELAELQQLHGAAGENLSRESDIEKLLGLFARVGEM